MIGGVFLRRAALVTLMFFAFFTFAADLAMAKPQEDDLTMAKRLYQDGDYEGSIKLLSKFIDKLKAMVEQKKNVAEAFYLLAKIYFEVGDDTKVDENLQKVFETYPTFTKTDENNFGFKDRVERVREKFLKQKEEEAQKMQAELKEQQPEAQEFTEETKTKSDESNVIEHPAQKKKKKKFPVLLVVGGIIVVGVLVFLLTKKKKKEYTLTVTRTEGVGGSPAAGTTTYKEGSTVNYSFTREAGYTDLSVTLDGQPAAASGTITMNSNHSLAASTTKVGQVTGAIVRVTVIFTGENLKVGHKVAVDGVTRIDERLQFDQHYNGNHTWDQLQKITRNFLITKDLGTFTIRQEALQNYTGYYAGETLNIGSTKYQLEVVSYTYANGADPGPPTLSEEEFNLNCAPWNNDPGTDWYRIKTQDVTLQAPAITTASKSSGKTGDKPQVQSHGG